MDPRAQYFERIKTIEAPAMDTLEEHKANLNPRWMAMTKTNVEVAINAWYVNTSESNKKVKT
jgi:hypothetical protein